MKTRNEIADYLHKAMLSFNIDPADSAYQKGYEACLEELYKFIYFAKQEEGGTNGPTCSIRTAEPTQSNSA